MSEERMQILRMIQSGQISAEEGAKLLAALKASSKGDAASQASAPRWFRVSVTDAATGKNKVNMSIPMTLVDVAIKMGARFVPETADANLDELREAPRTGQQGKILTVEDREDGELVEIFVE